MPRFFFDLDKPDGFERDEVGLTFDSLDAAYLSANKAAMDIGFELLSERRNPYRHRFEVRDDGGQLVLELPFSEALLTGLSPPRPRAPDAQARLQATLDRSRELKADLVDALAKAREAAMTGLALTEVNWTIPGALD